MSLWRRIANALSGDRLNREIDEEFEAHIEEAIRAGRDPDEARRAFGSVLRQREVSRRVRAAGWLDALGGRHIRVATDTKEQGHIGCCDLVAGSGDGRMRGGVPIDGCADVASAAGSARGSAVRA